MTDNQMFALVRDTILAGLTARALAGWDVARSFAPMQQGAPTKPTVYLFKLSDVRHGSPQQKDVWDAAGVVMTHTVSQQYETSFQASVMMTESTDPAALTPSDVLSMVCDIMQTDEGTTKLRAQGVGILRVREVRNPYNTNDAGQFAASPSFDFVLTYRRDRITTAPFLVTIDRSVNRV